MMQAAKKFVAFWTFQRGSEKGEDQTFWNSLLADVLGVADTKRFIQYQVPVRCKGTTKFLDAWIPSTRVLIEHKTRGVDLDAPQAGHDGLTPFQQARNYDNNRPMREKARWIVVCNFDEIRIHDMNADVPETTFERVTLGRLAKEVHRLKFLVQAEDAIRARELEVSVKAGRVVGQLYGAFLESYGAMANDPEILKALNKLCVRLVFCVYAEDAGVFAKDQFLDFMRKFHFSSFHLQLAELFKVLRLKPEARGPFFSEELKAFPYVGGALFKEDVPIAPFSEKAARILLENASEAFDWSEISPTIFGAVFESTLNPETRRKDGMHYTSEENIHRVIDPLFLDALRAEFAAIKDEPNLKKRSGALVAFQEKLGSLRFLDPACGSGNFLTETYVSLRKLENEALALRFKGQGQFDLGDAKLVHVSINQFHGIEINDFAVVVAQTAMWIAECKMMQETNALLAKNFTPLPLADSANIVEGNALKMDWSALGRFDFIMGNPPFVGARNKTPEQSADMMSIFTDAKGKPLKTAGNVDYVAAWYWKACAYCGHAGRVTLPGVVDFGRGTRPACPRCAFVSTNSITQGEQVAAVWKPLKERFGVEIDYAWKTFVWDSEATDMAHVHVVIVGFHAGDGAHGATETRRLFGADGSVVEAQHVNGYLMDGPDVFVESRTKPLCDVPAMVKGSSPVDGGGFFLDQDQRNRLCKESSTIEKYALPFLGAREFLHNEKRWCLWLLKASPAEMLSSSFVKSRIERVQQFRIKSTKEATRKFADFPARFMEVRQPESNYILIPRHSSERRNYIPFGFCTSDIICGDANNMVPNATLYHFGVLTSSVHMAWMRAVAGRLKSDYRYSNDIVYNNFPWPDAPAASEKLEVNSEELSNSATVHSSLVTTHFREAISQTAQAILDARALYPDSSLADLYDPLTMPPELRKAHAANDAAVLACYGFPPDLDESALVARLFEMYAGMVARGS